MPHPPQQRHSSAHAHLVHNVHGFVQRRPDLANGASVHSTAKVHTKGSGTHAEQARPPRQEQPQHRSPLLCHVIRFLQQHLKRVVAVHRTHQLALDVLCGGGSRTRRHNAAEGTPCVRRILIATRRQVQCTELCRRGAGGWWRAATHLLFG